MLNLGRGSGPARMPKALSLLLKGNGQKRFAMELGVDCYRALEWFGVDFSQAFGLNRGRCGKVLQSFKFGPRRALRWCVHIPVCFA